MGWIYLAESEASDKPWHLGSEQSPTVRQTERLGILLSRMGRGEIDNGPIWDDVCTLKGEMLPDIDIIFGGFPCQDISVAGKGAGLGEGTRSGLYSEIIRLAGELRPRYIFLENVSAITVRGGERVIGDLTEAGYDCEWLTLSAADVGASHGRERWWCLAHARRQRPTKRQVESSGPIECGEGMAHPEGQRSSRDSRSLQHEDGRQDVGLLRQPDGAGEGVGDTAGSPERGLPFGKKAKKPGLEQPVGILGHASSQGLQEPRPAGHEEPRPQGSGRLDDRPELPSRPPYPGDREAWAEILRRHPEVEPAIRGMASRIPNRNDRIRALGNSVDWPTAQEAFCILSGLTPTKGE